MSQEKLQAFAEAVSKSEELQKQFNLIQMEALRSTAEKLANLSESAGTPFTAEAYLKSVAQSSEELSPEQLRSVAGGLTADEVLGNLWRSLTHPGICAVRVAGSLINNDDPISGLVADSC